MNEATFTQAVLIAAAFIQNGDIRVDNNFEPRSAAMDKVHSILMASYQTLLSVRNELDDEKAG